MFALIVWSVKTRETTVTLDRVVGEQVISETFIYEKSYPICNPGIVTIRNDDNPEETLMIFSGTYIYRPEEPEVEEAGFIPQ